MTKGQDGRHGKRVQLKLTPAGESVLGESWVERVEQVLCERPAQAAALERTLRNLLSAMQRVNGQRAFGLCRQCAHFLTEDSGARCGLTREPLATEQTVRIRRARAAATAERV